MKNEVVELLGQGVPYSEIQRRTGASKATTSYHAKRLREGKPTQWGAGRRYDWGEVQKYYDAGHGTRECMRHFGFTAGAWAKAIAI